MVFALLDLEELEDKDLAAIRGGYLKLATSARESLRKGRADTGRDESKPAPTRGL